MKKLLLLITILFTVHAGFQDDMANIAQNMANTSLPGLTSTSLSSLNKPLTITTIEFDDNYDISMKPIWDALMPKLNAYAKKVNFAPHHGAVSSIARSMQSSAKESAIMDSLALGGHWIIEPDDPQTVYFQISLYNKKGNILFTSQEYAISKSNAPAALKRDLFKKIGNEDYLEEIIYKGDLIEKLDNLFNTSSSHSFLTSPATFSFVNNSTYGLEWQTEIIKGVLSRRYGIKYANVKDRILIQANNTFKITRLGKSMTIPNICDGTPLFPMPEDSIKDTAYITMDNKYTPIEIPQEGFMRKVNSRIETLFNEEFPCYFEPFNMANLKKLFTLSGEKTILVGSIDKKQSNPVTGKEVVRYSWRTASDWLNGLQAIATQKKYRFKLKTKLMSIIQDNSDPYRYWAVVRQEWRTESRGGKLQYEDNGFLVVNLNFNEDASLKNFKIEYRLWFYEYEYDHRQDGVVITSRGQKLANDLDREFRKGFKGGINKEVQEKISTYIVDQMDVVRGSIRF